VVEIEVRQVGHRLGHIAILDLFQMQVQAHQDLTAHQVVLLVAFQDRLLLHQVMEVALHQVVDLQLDLVEEDQDNFNENHIEITHGFGAIIH
tara:strand:+ start:52 stop:327 length:276 start_codon:yes stop_codon:yes gene_type:complete